jgi:hypothetical protein
LNHKNHINPKNNSSEKGMLVCGYIWETDLNPNTFQYLPIFIAISTIIYIIIGYVLLAIVAYFIQEKFIFKPEKLSQDFKYKYDAPFKEINFEVEQGVTINGLHFFTAKPKG